MKKSTLLVLAAIVIIAAAIFIPKYKNSDEKIKKQDVVQYISSYTTGVISSKSSIRIRLLNEIQNADEIANYKLFTFDPPIEGKTILNGKRILEFIPEKPMPSGVIYKAIFNLGKLVNVPKEISEFNFKFQIIKQNLEFTFDKISNYEVKDRKWQIVEGKISAADNVDISLIKEICTATIGEKHYNISFEKTSLPNEFAYRVDSVPRTENETLLRISWDGSKIGFEQQKYLNVLIPSLYSFKVVQVNTKQQPGQFISIVFSDPLSIEQDVKGLVSLGNTRLKLSVNGNELKIYPLQNLVGSYNLSISSAIRNILGDKLKSDSILPVVFSDIKPNVELLGKGVIFPNTDGIKFPFRAVNLRAINVRIIKIYEKNIAQFLQVNQIDESNEIKRVGRVVYKNTVDLLSEKSIDYGVWNTFALQLDKLIDTEPGAIYRVELTYNRSQSLYYCNDSSSVDNMQATTNTDDENWDENEESDDESFWDYYEDNDNSYNYSERKNPCKDSYYRNKKVVRNIFASDFGIIVKSGSDNNMKVIITELGTTNPLSGVNIKILNFQQHELSTGITNSDGIADLLLRNKAYMLIAEKDGKFGYLRLDNGSSLSLSKFDISGKIVQKGIKGFIYTERGIWRPGDTLFMNFILQDKSQQIPDNHPIMFELINPKGQIIETLANNKPIGDIYTFITKTDKEAITGNYMLRVRAGGAIFSKKLRIETFKPNRLKINFDFGLKKLFKDDNEISANLNVKWLHGAIAQNLKADVKVSLSQKKTVFKKFADFVFDDPTRKFINEEQVIFDDKLDAEGNAEIKMLIRANSESPGILNANFKVKVFENSGAFSIDRFSIPYYPYSTYVGIKLPKGDKARGMLLTDIKHNIDIVTVDANGKYVDANLKVEVYKIEWKWWWEKNSDDDLSKYGASSHYRPLSTSFITTKNGVGKGELEIKYPDWGRYLVRVVDVVGGHSTAKIVYLDWPGWAGRASKDNPGGASMLTFSTDKSDYNVGDLVKLNFPSSAGGRALVSIENGSRVIKTFWVNTDDKTTNFSFNTDAEMAPNVFVSITLIQPHNFTKNDLPIRLYGIVPINVIDQSTKLYPQLSVADVLRPNKKVIIKVSEKNAKAMDYTIAIVDDGILDVTRFKTPNPWAAFNAREALGVRTWDMYEYVMGAYSGEISALLEIGGDGSNLNGSKKKANRFKPVVRFLGPFHLDAGQVNTNSFIMPQYVGSVRTMVIAAGNNAYGNAEKTSFVKDDLMVLATLPRVVGPQEKVVMPITIFAMDKAIKDVKVMLRTNGLLKVVGDKAKKVHFSKTGDKVVNFDLEVANRTGVAKLEILAKSGSTTAIYNIEIDVRNSNPYITKVYQKTIEGGEKWTTSFDLTGIKGTNSAYIELSSIPQMNIESRLKYLINYPHGCIEQTTSAVFPQLYLSDITELEESDKNRINNNISEAIDRLMSFQTSDGGFAYWPGGTKSNNWGSSYAGHFLIEAQSKGYVIPNGLLERWVNYQKHEANNWNASGGSQLQQAYRLYTIALSGNVELGAMNRLKESNNLGVQAKWRLAGAYALAGYKTVANSIVDNAKIEISETTSANGTYGSNIRDRAMILEVMVLLKRATEAANILKDISTELSSKKWMSTQSTAYSLIAISKYINGYYVGDGFKYKVDINSKKGVAQEGAKAVSQIKIKNLKNKNTVSILNSGRGVIYASIVSIGVPEIGVNTASNNNLQIEVDYFSLDGARINPDKIKQGSDFKVEVRVSNPMLSGEYKNIALTQIFPSGWEIHNSRLDDVNNSNSAVYDFMDIRDDRALYYFDIKANESKTFTTYLNASYLGKFYLPSVNAELMYDNSINASTAGKWIEVVK